MPLEMPFEIANNGASGEVIKFLPAIDRGPKLAGPVWAGRAGPTAEENRPLLPKSGDRAAAVDGGIRYTRASPFNRAGLTRGKFSLG
jgi:hypothetical protein